MSPLEAYLAMEAMHRAVPPELLESGNFGFLVSKDVASGLVEYIRPLLSYESPFYNKLIFDGGEEFLFKGIKCRVV